MYPTISVVTTYQGVPLTQPYYDSHPDIHPLYPSPQVFLTQLYVPLLEKASATHEPQLLEMSENRVAINGQLIELLCCKQRLPQGTLRK